MTATREDLHLLGISLRYAAPPARDAGLAAWREYAERALEEASTRGLAVTVRPSASRLTGGQLSGLVQAGHPEAAAAVESAMRQAGGAIVDAALALDVGTATLHRWLARPEMAPAAALRLGQAGAAARGSEALRQRREAKPGSNGAGARKRPRKQAP